MPTSKPFPEEDIPAAEANRRFSELLRGVREEGRRYVVTSHGRAVAKLTPIDQHDAEARKAEAEAADAGWARLIERLESQPALHLGRFSRDDAYED